MTLIRLATTSDLESIVAMDQFAHTQVDRRELIANSVSDSTCYVAVLASETVGYAMLNYSFYHQGFVEMLYIAEIHRRTGVGTALLEHMERTCRTQKLFASTNLSNLPMQALLKKLGFVVSGVIDNLDEGDPELVFLKRLEK